MGGERKASTNAQGTQTPTDETHDSPLYPRGGHLTLTQQRTPAGQGKQLTDTSEQESAYLLQEAACSGRAERAHEAQAEIEAKMFEVETARTRLKPSQRQARVLGLAPQLSLFV